MQFLSRHPFAFAPFPSQYYVGVRRNLPVFDYATFIRRVRENCVKKVPTPTQFQSFPNFQSRPVSRPLLSTNESFEQLSPVEGPGGLPLSSMQSAANPLANAHSMSGLANGFSANGHGHGHGASNALGGGGGINGLGCSKGSLSQPYLHQAQHQPVLTPTTQKPIFSLFGKLGYRDNVKFYSDIQMIQLCQIQQLPLIRFRMGFAPSWALDVAVELAMGQLWAALEQPPIFGHHLEEVCKKKEL